MLCAPARERVGLKIADVADAAAGFDRLQIRRRHGVPFAPDYHSRHVAGACHLPRWLRQQPVTQQLESRGRYPDVFNRRQATRRLVVTRLRPSVNRHPQRARVRGFLYISEMKAVLGRVLCATPSWIDPELRVAQLTGARVERREISRPVVSAGKIGVLREGGRKCRVPRPAIDLMLWLLMLDVWIEGRLPPTGAIAARWPSPASRKNYPAASKGRAIVGVTSPRTGSVRRHALSWGSDQQVRRCT